MADVIRRSIEKVTYAPVHPSPQDESSGAVLMRRRGLEKVAYAAALRAQPSEVAAIKAATAAGVAPGLAGALDAIAAVSGANRTPSGWAALGRVPADALIAAGRALATHRRAQRAEFGRQARALAADHAAFVRSQLESAVAHPATPAGDAGGAAAGVMWRPSAAPDPRLNAVSLKPTFAEALAWARVRNPARADSIVDLATDIVGGRKPHVPHDIDGDLLAGVVAGTVEETSEWTDDLTDGFMERMKVEPIGRLHLERIDMTPVGIVRGELVHSIGLAPAETVTVIHREWSSRETSFEKVVSEEFEQSTEDGVTENTELTQGTETQSRHSSALSMEASGSGSWGFASASLTVGYNTSSDDETSKRDSRNHSIGVTRKAAARSRKEHKTTFTVKQQAGVEDQSVRTLTNPSQTDPLRIDFHQMLRDWKVDLYRYGIRQTYDIVVPAPGIDLLGNVDELRRIDYELSQPFLFSLLPAEITRDKWQALAARYGADVEPPEPETLQQTQSFTYPAGGSDDYRFDNLEFDAPTGYVVHSGFFQAFVTLNPTGHFNVPQAPGGAIGHSGPDPRVYERPLDFLQGHAGHLLVVMASNALQSGTAIAVLEFAQTADSWSAWQNRAWTALRKGAQDRWQVQRQELQTRRDRLADDISKWDPLALRRMEREEVMKTTLKWIFGPAFDLMPSEVSRLYGGENGGLASLEPSKLTVNQWAQTLGLGEFIKFLHQAIEWEHVLFFVYPYFWDHPQNHSLKRFLHHPDDIHQQFLRGGAARVVLTVRPDFNDAFIKLVEGGSTTEALAVDHPYLTIAQEIQAYADTTYPGIPAAGPNSDPEAVDAAERGKLIATWHEFTPVSALDITVNTPLDQLK